MDEIDDTDNPLPADETAGPNMAPSRDEDAEAPADRLALVKRVLKEIKLDKQHHDKAFKRMRDSQQLATWGKEKNWGDRYTANIAGSHVKHKTAALYAKNPKVVAERRETMDFQLWDETPQMLQNAMLMAQMPPTQSVDPLTGAVAMQPNPMAADGQALIADVQAGMARRTQMKKLGKTLELLFAYFMDQQKPLDFKAAMKKLVRRTCTTCVGYVEVGFQREMGPRPGLTEELTDARQRLDHLQKLAEDLAEGEVNEDDAEMAELTLSVEALMNEPEIVLQEGLVFDFPASTKVIPDRITKSIVGFIGSRRVTVELYYTKDQVKELFGIELSSDATTYSADLRAKLAASDDDQQLDMFVKKDEAGDLVCVYKCYDKPSGLVYYLCDGHKDFLREPASPDVFVEDFWPIYAITFNDVENEDELFPPSDVELIRDSQLEHNRSRQGKREHRDAAKPRWVAGRGTLDEKDWNLLRSLGSFETAHLNMPPQAKISDILQAVPVPGVDPNLYETSEFFTDAQLSVGAQSAQLGGISKATATESAIAEGSSNEADSASIDDLDAFLTRVARASGQILLREMSAEKVTEIVGPGAFWPELPLSAIVSEIGLKIQAGSTGKPNQATEIRNWREMAPLLMQMPGLGPTWLLRETLRRLDDRMDVTEAFIEGMPSIMAQNRMQQMPPQDPNAAPDQQGAKGGDSPAPPSGPAGTGPAMGDNHDHQQGPGSTGAAPTAF